MAEEGRQKYDQDMASYRQAGLSATGDNASSAGGTVTQSGTTYTEASYGNLL